MKLKYEFEQVEMDGRFMAVLVGANAGDLHAMFRLNETAAFIFDCLKNEITEEELIKKFADEYEAEKDTATEYVREYTKQLRESGILE